MPGEGSGIGQGMGISADREALVAELKLTMKSRQRENHILKPRALSMYLKKLSCFLKAELGS